LMLPDSEDAKPDVYARDLLRKAGLLGALGRDHVLAITDGSFKVVAASPLSIGWEGRNLDSMVSGGQPIFLFGDRAGAMEVKIDGEDWFAAADLTERRDAAAIVMIPKSAVLAAWR